MTLEDYVTQLAPQFSAQQISQAVAIYSDVTGLDTVTDQAIAVMGECELIDTNSINSNSQSKRLT